MAAARAMLPPSNWMIRLGRTGAMMPKARKSKSTVTRMKTKAARLAWGCGVGGVPAHLHFEDDGKNEGPLGGLLADVAFQVHADFFLDDAPVGFFFGVGFFDGLQDDEPRAGNKFLAVVAHQTARHDFRMRFHLARMFVNRDDRHDDPVFGKMFSNANHDVFDFQTYG